MGKDLDIGYNLTVEELDAKTGEVLHQDRIHNLLLDNGRAAFIRMLHSHETAGSESYFFYSVQTGTSDTPVVVTQTGLQGTFNTIHLTIANGNITITKNGYGDWTVVAVMPMYSGNGQTWKEAGLVVGRDSTGLLTVARAVHNAVAKNDLKVIRYTWNFVFG